MVQFTMASGLRVCQMVKVGADTQMDQNTKGFGKTANLMELESNEMVMARLMMENGKWENVMDWGPKYFLTGPFMLELGLMEDSLLENALTQIRFNTKETGLKESLTDMEFEDGQTGVSMKENGIKENLMGTE